MNNPQSNVCGGPDVPAYAPDNYLVQEIAVDEIVIDQLPDEPPAQEVSYATG